MSLICPKIPINWEFIFFHTQYASLHFILIKGSAFKMAAPRVISRTPIEGWKEAVSHIINYRRVSHNEIQIGDFPGIQLGWKDDVTKEIDLLHQQGNGTTL